MHPQGLPCIVYRCLLSSCCDVRCRVWLSFFLFTAGAVLLLSGGCRSESLSASSAAVADSAQTEPAMHDTISVTGTLFDVTCDTQGISPGECDGTYVSQGDPVGLRTKEGTNDVWILVMVPQALADYLNATARAKGRVRSNGVLVPLQIEVRNGSVWTAVM